MAPVLELIWFFVIAVYKIRNQWNPCPRLCPCPRPCTVNINVHVPAGCPCTCLMSVPILDVGVVLLRSMSLSMLHVHLNAACPCLCYISIVGRSETGSLPKVVVAWLYFKRASHSDSPLNHSVYEVWEAPARQEPPPSPAYSIQFPATRESPQQCLAFNLGPQRPGASGYTDFRPPKAAQGPPICGILCTFLNINPCKYYVVILL